MQQSSWVLFLKYLDDLEAERAIEAQLNGKPYEFIFTTGFRWSTWAKPTKADGTPGLDAALIGMDLIEFVNNSLMPCQRGITQSAPGPDAIQYKIGEIFGEVRNKSRTGIC